MKKNIWWIPYLLLLLLLLLLFLSIVLRYFAVDTYYKLDDFTSMKETLKHDGIAKIPNLLPENELQSIVEYVNQDKIKDAKHRILQSLDIQNKIKNLLGPDYEFHDYVFIIKKSQFHTCHRDYNGDFFNKKQKYPSYTMIVYLENMNKCLDIIPKSHKSMEHNYNITDYSQTVQCGKGDALIFNANLVHNGALNEKDNNMRIQLKISHKSDKDVLYFYNNYNKVLNSENKSPMILKKIQKHITCQFPIISHYVKEYDKNVVSDKSDGLSVLFSPFFAQLDTVK